MTGSSLVPIVVPIVVTIALALWLGIVFYVADHPEWKARTAPTRRPAGAEEPPGTPGQARPGQAAVTAAHGAAALEPGASGDPEQPPSLPSRRAA